MGALQLCLLSVLLWFSWDQQAHHRLHHFLDQVCKMCGGHGHGEAEDSHHAPESDDADCAITMIAKGRVDAVSAATDFVAVRPLQTFLLPLAAAPVFVSASDHLLPFACGPPAV